MQPVYEELLGTARRHTRLAHEAEDLVQTALLAALEAGRADLSSAPNRLWLHGVIRNQARMKARSAVRRKAREAGYTHPAADEETASSRQGAVFAWVRSLPASLRPVAALALTGHTRAEIRSALGIPDTALRQRLLMLRRAAAAQGGLEPGNYAGLRADLAHGVLRRSLPAAVTRRQAVFGTYDPDGNLLIFRVPPLTNSGPAATGEHTPAAGAGAHAKD